MKIARPVMALSCFLAWNVFSVHRDAVVVAQSAGNRTISGEFIVDPPTLINLGFERFIQGDDNRTASVAVAYRKQGEAQWNSALPLLRLQGERISANDRMDVISPNMFAGSILDLEPGTAYDVRLTLSDPDGVSGEATKNVTVRTRPEPMPHIADSTFIGRNDPDHVIGWSGAFWAPFDGVAGQTFPPAMASYVAIKLYGPGHVVAYDYVANFHDGVNVEVYGNPDGSAAIDGPKYPTREYFDRRPVAIDFYNNYMTNFHDNPFETGGSMHKVRVMRNMMINSASHAFCNQPAVGGPVYWIRNIAYHLPGGSSRLTGGSAGVLFYNNTILSETSANGTSNTHWRNNLFLGESSAPAIFSVNTYTNYTSSDYNGFRPNPGAATSFHWNSPPSAVAADFAGLTTGGGRGGGAGARLEQRQFPTLAAYSGATGEDRNSVLVDYDIFVNVPKLDAQDRTTVQRVYKAEDFDFRLKPGSAAVDRGTPLAGITDGFSGKAPDLGALELGQVLPHYGPR
jgi:hypothetical protein